MSKRKVLACVAVVVVVAIAGFFVWNYIDEVSALKHETDRWAVIQDDKGDHIAVEPNKDTVWEQLVQLYENESEMWIGGIVEPYGNKWGFRFKPENVTIAQVTAEGSQSTIRGISEDLEYWLDYGYVYVFAKVTEVHNIE